MVQAVVAPCGPSRTANSYGVGQFSGAIRLLPVEIGSGTGGSLSHPARSRVPRSPVPYRRRRCECWHFGFLVSQSNCGSSRTDQIVPGAPSSGLRLRSERSGCPKPGTPICPEHEGKHMTQSSDSPRSGGLSPFPAVTREGSPNRARSVVSPPTPMSRNIRPVRSRKRQATLGNTSPASRASRPSRWLPKRRNR